MQIGDKVFTVDLKDPNSYREYTVTKIGKDTVQCGSPEYTFYKAFVWPISVKDELLAIVTETWRLQNIVDDRMKLIYELKNQISRGEK